MSDAAVPATEHFVTLFNHKFLPMGMALHESLRKHAQPMRLWVICMDEAVESQLRELGLEDLSIIPLREVETSELLAVKPGRSAGEYCWTLTPFAAQAVMDREPTASRVTYVDADLYFFDQPGKLLAELDESGKDVLMTEHHYAPEYDQSAISGRFCVQFVTFRNNASARKVMTWWQDRCIEWCFARHEDGKFGDQKYLDIWPQMFAGAVHVLVHNERVFAPWNVKWQCRMLQQRGESSDHDWPVFYHFHGARPEGNHWLRGYHFYRVGRRGQRFYDHYADAFSRQASRLQALKIPLPVFEPIGGLQARFHRLYARLTGKGPMRQLRQGQLRHR